MRIFRKTELTLYIGRFFCKNLQKYNNIIEITCEDGYNLITDYHKRDYAIRTKRATAFYAWKIGNFEIKNRIVLTSMGGTNLFGWMGATCFDIFIY